METPRELQTYSKLSGMKNLKRGIFLNRGSEAPKLFVFEKDLLFFLRRLLFESARMDLKLKAQRRQLFL